MTEATRRRTEALKLRQTISQLLDEIFAIEHSMELFHANVIRASLSAPQRISMRSGYPLH
jgi:hypothetical protein